MRRSARETPTNRSMSSNPSGTRKSERLEKRTPTPLVKGKDKKQSTQSPLRRSERGKKQFSSSSSGSKKSNKNIGISVMKKKVKKEKSVKQLTFETEEVSRSKTQVEKKRLNARDYRALFNLQRKKVSVAGCGKELNLENKLSQECSSSDEGGASKNVGRGNECGRGKVEELRKIHTGRGSERTKEESNCSLSKPADEIVENNIGLDSSLSSQNHKFVEGAHLSEDGTSLENSKGGDCVLLSSHKTVSGKQDDCDEMAKKIVQSELVTPASSGGLPDSGGGLDIGSKDIPPKRKRNTDNIDSDSTALASSKDVCPPLANAIISSPHGSNFAESCATSFKKQRVNHELQNTKDICNASLPKDRGEIGRGVTTGLAEQCITNLESKNSSGDFQLDGNQNICLICKLGGKLLCCEGRGCKRSYHLSCLDPLLKDVPPGVWYCLACVRKKIKLGVYSVSEGMESIWDVKEVEVSGLQKKQYLVKYKGLAHVHNQWVPESQLLVEAPSLIAKFNRKTQVQKVNDFLLATKWKSEWTEPHRLLQKRLIEPLKQHDEVQLGCRYEWLVKWHGLDYEQATWELEKASFMELPKVQSLMKDYENRHEKAKRGHCLFGIDKLSAGSLTGIDNNRLDFIRYLLDCWQKGQNAVIIDDQLLCLQERIVKVIKFISSLSSYVSRPFLVISTALSLWDEEFCRLTPSLDAVFYHGDKDLRRSIRAVEFVGGEGIMFEVLVTSPEIIAEDLNVLGSVKWEAIIVDDCQRYKVQSSVEQIKGLSTEMRLLLFNGQLKDCCIEHLLALLDCQSDMNGFASLSTKSSHKMGNLKERLSKYIVNGSKSDSLKFVEYWVPVQISNIQLEQYCATLFSNSLFLCSSSKNDLVGALSDILVSIRKCCDHPYLMDPSPEDILTKDAKVVDILDIGIKASGKLQLLQAMLIEIRNRGSRVIVLFQSSGPGKDKIGDILDDFVRQRFGQDSYERIDGCVNQKRKQAALNNFNNQKTRFVFLLESCACLPSIKLSSVDTVIIFGSDWIPANDLRNLRKITLDSQFEQLKVFRLYSSFTVEENVLILAKHDKILDSNVQSISRATTQSLLMRGASYLFRKLDEFQNSSILNTNRSSSFDESSEKDVIRDFLTILSQDAKDNNSSTFSVIVKAKLNQGTYVSDPPLPGERKSQVRDEEFPHRFWKKLLEGKQPEWTFTSGLSQRNRKRVQNSEDILKKPEGEHGEVVKKHKKAANNDVGQNHFESAPFEGNTDTGNNEGNLGGPSHNVHQLMSGSSDHLNASYANHAPSLQSLTNVILDEPSSNMAKSNERINVHDSQKSLHLLLKPDMAKLCEILKLPDNVKAMVQSFLEYVMNNHHVIREPATILQAFQISLCWTAASLLKHKIDHKESLALAKQHLNFGCKKEEADYVYSKFRCLKKVFLYHTGNVMLTCSSENSQSVTRVVNKEYLQARSGQELLQLGLAKQDFSKSIKDIERKCDKQMRKVSQKQQEEIVEFNKKYNEEKAQLEYKQKTEAAVIRLHSNSSMRKNKLKLLDIEYKKKFEELEQQMVIRRKDLEEMHMAARDKLKKRKACWLEGVKSWAQVELINKPPSNKIGHNQENAASVNSYLKKQNPEVIQGMQNKKVPLEVPETVSSDDDDDYLLPGVQSTNEQIFDGVRSDLPDGEAPLRISTAISLRDGLEVNVPSSREQFSNAEVPLGVSEAVSSSDGAEHTNKFTCNEHNNGPTVMRPQNLSMGGSEIANSVGSQENIQGLESSPEAVIGERDGVQALNLENATEVDEEDVVCIANKDPNSRMIAGYQHNEKVSSGAIESASNKAASDNSCKQQNEKALMERTISNDSSDKTAGLGQQDTGAASGVPETALIEEIQGGETSKEQDGMIEAIETVNNEDSQSLGKTAGLGQQDTELLSGVIETAPSDVGDGGSSDTRIGGCAVASCASTRVVQQDLVVPVTNEDNHLQEPSLALQVECLLPTGSTRLQDGVASVSMNPDNLQQVDASVQRQNDIAASPENVDAHVAEHVLQMPPTESAISVNAMDLPSTSETQHQSNHEDFITCNIAGTSMPMVEDQVQCSDLAISQHGTHTTQHLPADIPVHGSGTHVSDTRTLPISSGVNNYTVQTVPPVRVPPLPFYHDPLQVELERLRKEAEQIVNAHENTKLQLKSDCEQEVAQIRKKYEVKLQELESEFLMKKKEMDMNEKKVLMNKILAEAFRSKCMDVKASSAPGIHQEVPSGFVQQLLQRSSQPAIVTGLSSAGQPTSGQQIAIPSAHSTSSLHAAHHSPGHLSGNLTRPPHINNISPATGNLQIGSEIRCPAPHLQPFRPSASTTPSLAVGTSSQQVPSNPPTTSSPPFQPAFRPQPSTQQSHPHNNAHGPETTRFLPPLSRSSLSEIELLMEVDNQTNTNTNTNPSSNLRPLPSLGSDSDPVVRPELVLLNNTRASEACPSEVVCLSDDD
ncbi:helicase protein MOM1 isoform X4 [Ricinus communis]|uniref:helicase protein MOM1 isoform X4 n=1 Tax=Ricinus communis TaxID=3988 RepID=UPI00201B0D92|nr:helicase protein MOM1 isoform X4 [Ricinus communis]